MTNSRIKTSDEARRRVKLREELNQTFKEKGVTSLLDKRRIIKEIFGENENISKTGRIYLPEDIEKAITYLNSKTQEELKSPIIGWLVVTQTNEGMTKSQMRRLMTEIPASFGTVPISYHADATESVSVYGYINYPFYRENEKAIFAAFQAIQINDLEKHSLDLYLLDNQLQLTSFATLEPTPEETQRLLDEKQREKDERRAYMKQKKAEIRANIKRSTL